MKYRVEIVRGVNKGRIMDIDEDKAEQFVAEHKVRILQVITNDAPPAETPGFIEVSTEVSGSIDYHERTPEATGDELEDEERCSALTKSGERCKNACVEGNQCRLHVTKVIASVQIDAQASLYINKE